MDLLDINEKEELYQQKNVLVLMSSRKGTAQVLLCLEGKMGTATAMTRIQHC